jgi:hypothetical protein
MIQGWDMDFVTGTAEKSGRGYAAHDSIIILELLY